ncbi:MAG TPA: hypothetical protein VGL02_20420 [Streptomyces sp.]
MTTPNQPSTSNDGAPTPRDVWSLLAAQFTPPSFWTDSPPPLRATKEWAVSGEHLPPDDLSRHGSHAWAWVAIGLRTIALHADWVFQRGSRTTAALLLLMVLNQVLPFPQLLHAASDVAGWLQFT